MIIVSKTKPEKEKEKKQPLSVTTAIANQLFCLSHSVPIFSTLKLQKIYFNASFPV